MSTTPRIAQAVVAAATLAAAIAMHQSMVAGSSRVRQIAGLAGTSVAVDATSKPSSIVMSGMASPVSRQVARDDGSAPTRLSA